MPKLDIYDVTYSDDPEKIKDTYTDKTNLVVRICRRISDIEFSIDAKDNTERYYDDLRSELDECNRVLSLITV